MSVIPTFTGAVPTVGADFDTWGGELNTGLGNIKTDIDALAAQGNMSETQAADALPKAGGTMTGDLILSQAGPTSSYSAGFMGAPPADFSVDKTLALPDASIAQRAVGGTVLNLTIPSGVFPLGTIIPIRNSTGVALNIVRGAGVTLTVVGSATNANATMAARGFGSIWQESNNVWLIQGVGVS